MRSCLAYSPSLGSNQKRHGFVNSQKRQKDSRVDVKARNVPMHQHGNTVSKQNETPPSMTTSSTGAGTVFLIAMMVLVFLLDRVAGLASLQKLYLSHASPQWYQFVTCAFCHASWEHLSNNLLMLLVFGKEVESENGTSGLLVSFTLCGAFSAFISYLLLPKASVAPGILPNVSSVPTVSIGASGAVFGLFSVACLTKLSLNLRRLIEAAVLGQFVLKQFISESKTVIASGGKLATGGISHIAHLSGALAGVLLVAVLSALSNKLVSESK